MKLKEQYISDKNGNKTGVVLSIDEYRQVLADLEELESIRAYDEAVTSDEEAIPFEQAVAEIKRADK